MVNKLGRHFVNIGEPHLGDSITEKFFSINEFQFAFDSKDYELVFISLLVHWLVTTWKQQLNETFLKSINLRQRNSITMVRLRYHLWNCYKCRSEWWLRSHSDLELWSIWEAFLSFLILCYCWYKFKVNACRRINVHRDQSCKILMSPRWEFCCEKEN